MHPNKGHKKVFTRGGLNWVRRFSVIAGALDIPGQVVINGEVAVNPVDTWQRRQRCVQADAGTFAHDRDDSEGCGLTPLLFAQLGSQLVWNDSEVDARSPA